jgi:uncharacterized protein
MKALLLVVAGAGIGLMAGFAGIGGGAFVVPLLLAMGVSAQKTVGTSFVAILIISIASLFAHNRLGAVDWKLGLLLGAGGVAGSQLGAHLLQSFSTVQFRRIFAGLLVVVAGLMFFKK